MQQYAPDIAPLRPTASALADRKAAAAYGGAHLRPTATDRPHTRFYNLEGAFLETGVLQELILSAAQQSRAGMPRNAAIGVITSDSSVAGYVAYLAKEFQLPLFVSDSVHEFAARARPVGDLTQADRDTFEAVNKLGGFVTSAALAVEVGLEPAAANNRLSNVEKKGYLFRISRSRREGDLYVAPCASPPAASMAHSLTTEVADEIELPPDMRESIASVAEEQGIPPSELIARAWRDYFARHALELGGELEGVRGMLRSDDTDGLLEYTTADIDSLAAKDADRARQRRQQRSANR